MAASDGGHVWPPRSSDLRIQELTGNGPEASKPDDVFKALRASGLTGSLDDMWRKHLAAKGITHTGEPFTDSIAFASAMAGDISEFTTQDDMSPYQYQDSGMGPAGTRFGMCVSSDGKYTYLCDATNNEFYQYELPTAWDLSSIIADPDPINTLTEPTTAHRYPKIARNGTYFYWMEPFTTQVHQVPLTTPHDISSAGTLVTTDLDVGGATGMGSVCEGIWFSNDGTRLFGTDTANDRLFQSELSTPWDVSTVGSPSFGPTLTGIGYPLGGDIAGDGLRVFVLTGTDVWQYNLTTAFQITDMPSTQNDSLTWGNQYTMDIRRDTGDTIIYHYTSQSLQRTWAAP